MESPSRIISALLLLSVALCVSGRYPSTTCSDEGCGIGIPCYLRPAEDECHYTDTDPCEGGDATALDQQLWLLNNSLVRLQEKLIQKGIIPAGKTCPPLPLIENGGVIYTDLLLSLGVIANYVCNDGYSLHGHGRFQCLEGMWIGDDEEEISVKPHCEDSLVVCKALVPIPFGHVSYHIVDTNMVLPGDLAYYSCDTLYTLQGAEYRVCLRNGTWSGMEPECIAPTTTEPSTTVQGSSSSSGNSTVTISLGVIGGVLGVVVIGILIFAIVKCARRRNPKHKHYERFSEVQGLDVTDTGDSSLESKKLTLSQIDEENPDSHKAGVATLLAEQK